MAVQPSLMFNNIALTRMEYCFLLPYKTSCMFNNKGNELLLYKMLY